MGESFDFNPPGQDERTEAAIGHLGKGYSTWLMRGIIKPADLMLGQVWQGTAAFPALPAVGGALTAISSSVSDQLSGSGARRLAVVYLNSKFEIRLATGDLGGLFVLPLFEFDQVSFKETATAVTDAIRVLDVQVTTVGTGLENAGDIDVKIGGVQQARVSTPITVVRLLFLNRAMPGAFTVPLGFIAVLDSFKAGPGPAVSLQTRPNTQRNAWMGVSGFAPDVVQTKSVQMDYRSPVVFGPQAELRFVYESVEIEGLTTHVAPELTLFLHPDTDTADSDPAQIPLLSRCGMGV